MPYKKGKIDDEKLAAELYALGVRWPRVIIHEAREAGVPLAWALALVEQESAFRNVFGHDKGSILHGQYVTHRRVLQLLDHIHRGGISNGVGLTQLTWPPYIRQAEALGGADHPRWQCHVGFRVFKEVSRGHYATLGWKYNGSVLYQVSLNLKHRRWKRALRRILG